MTNNKQQTAVQDFWDNISLKLSFEQIDEFVPLFYQAKEMEKEQKAEDWQLGYDECEFHNDYENLQTKSINNPYK